MNKKQAAAEETRTKILAGALEVIRRKGYSAASVDDLCAAAGVTKGAFFHHFKSKEEMAAAAAKFFGEGANVLFGTAPYMAIEDPFERFIGYIDFREEIIAGETHEFTCLLGTMVQEVHETHPAVRDACREFIWGHAETLVPMIEEALSSRGVRGADARDLALFTQAVLQGSFILAKADQSHDAAKVGVRHLKAYLRQVFGVEKKAV